uniref:Uncharacterized protein n=1 Tax=Panagrolaimus sp. ES5 TaxID=591445 RepID=A0AC34F2Q7_9BILA
MPGLPLKSSSPCNFALIDTEKDSLKLTVVDSENGKILPSLTFMADEKFENIKDFICNLSTLFLENSVKAVILQVFGFQTSEFPNNAEFCNYLKDALSATKIAFYFISTYNWVITSLFVHADIYPRPSGRVVCIFTGEEYINIASYKFTRNGYIKILERRFLANVEVVFSPEEFAALNCPHKIVATSSDFFPPPIRALHQMNLEKFVFVHPLNLLESRQTIVEISKWVLNSNKIRYHIAPTCARKYSIATKVDGKISAIISADLYAPLPYKKMISVAKSAFKHFLCYKNAGCDELIILSQINLPKNCHRNKVALTVDINNMPCFNIANVIFDQIATFPKRLNESIKSKIPIISFCDNFSVIFTWKNATNGYDFVDEWNGLYGEEMIVSFYDGFEEPKFHQKAAEDYQIKSSSVVFDLLRIISSPPKNIKPENYWGFKIIPKSSTNEIVVEVCDKNGIKKEFNISTILALFLKEHLKVIKESGATMEETNKL